MLRSVAVPVLVLLVAGVSAPAGAAAFSAASTLPAASTADETGRGSEASLTQESVRYVDRSEGSGLEHVTWSGGPDKDHILESAGNGVLVVDYDGDSWEDLYFVSAWRFDEEGGHEVHGSRLYRNRRDLTFADVTAPSGTATSFFGSGGCVGDFDADGLPDLYLTGLGPDRLLRNNGDGTFADVTEAAGIVADGWSTGAVFFDADGDGDQDLYVAAYIRTSVEEAQGAVRHRMWRGRVPVLDGPRGLPGDRDRFFRNEGDGTFVEVGEAAGLGPRSDAYGFAVVAFDHDGDGDPDLYVANDSQANALYENLGGGAFRDATVGTGLGFDGNGVEQGSMGVAVDDWSGDGLPDVAVTNFANDFYTLYRNLGGGLFLDASFETGVAVPTFTPLGWGTFFLDPDLDGDLDLFFANGHLYAQVDADPSLGESYRQRNQLLLNEGGTFRDLTDGGSGLALEHSSRGAAWADLDLDGDPDIVVSNQDERPNLLEREGRPAPERWIALELVDTQGDRMALGGRVELESGGRTQTRWIASGGSYLSQSSLRAHFGLAAGTVPERISVTWPDGERSEFGALEAGSVWRVVRGREPLQLAGAS